MFISAGAKTLSKITKLTPMVRFPNRTDAECISNCRIYYNSDSIVNILDLVAVANALGKTEPDLNGDGVVNIPDLVIVANAFE